MWPKRGPTRPACGGSGAPRRGPCQARQTPAGCPDKRARLGNRPVRGSPGGVWARDIPLYRRAVPGHRHGGTPAPCLSRPCARRWLFGPRGTMAAKCGDRSLLASWSWCAALERRDSKPPPSCADGRGAGHEGAVTRSSDIPLVTAHGRPGPAVSGAVRTQRGPASLRQGWFRSRPVADAFGAQVLRGQGPERPGTARPISSPRMGIGGTGLHSVTLRH